MLDAIREFGQSGALLLIGLAVGASWLATIVAPNTSYDHLKEAEADNHVRELLRAASDPIAVLLLVAGGLAILSGALVAGVTALISALGFFSNRWTLGQSPTRKASDSEHRASKTQRILAVTLTLIFTLVASIAAGLVFFGR